MAKQKGNDPVKGTIGNLTYYKSQDGYLMKSKGEVSKDKLAAKDRVTENWSEFGNAAASGKILRTPFAELLKQSSDDRMTSRLTALCMKVVKTDTVSDRGLRLVANGDMSLFFGFNFNKVGILSTVLVAPYSVTFSRTTGNIDFDLPPFTPKISISAPPAASSYQLTLMAAPVNFSEPVNKGFQTQSAILPWDNNLTTDLPLTLSLPANSTEPVFILLQVQFFDLVNGKYYILDNGKFNACAIINVDIPA